MWTIALDADGDVTDAQVERARVRSRAQARLRGRAAARSRRLPPGRRSPCCETIGELRIAQEAERGGVSLPMPAQEIDVADDRWPARVPRDAAGRVVERPALAAHRLRRRVDHGRRARSASCARCRRPRSTPYAGCVVRRGRWGSTGPTRWATPSSSARSTRRSPAAGGDGGGVHVAAARSRVRRLPRPPSRPDRARGAGLVVRPCHGAAAPAGRPLRAGDLRGAVRRASRCRRGCSTGWTSCRT